jgi:phosphatidylinositol glycan class M
MVLGRGRSKRAAPSPAQAAQQQQQQQQQQQRGRPPPPPTLVRRVATRATARISVWTGLPADATRLLLLATLVRLALIAWGEVQDRLSPDVKYTDTDYGVFTDAARSIWRGDGDPSAAVGGAPGERRGWMRGTPFARATYRYSPLLAYAVLPNLLVGVFGKLLFSAADLVAGVQSYRLAEAAAAGAAGGGGVGGSSNLESTAAVLARAAGWWAAAAWLFNPFTATVSTRGSCDSLAVVMLLGLLQLLLALGPPPTKPRVATARPPLLLRGLLADVWRDLPGAFRAVAPAALLYGLAVHFRIYPIIYAPSTVLFLARRRARAEQAAAAAGEEEAGATPQRRGGRRSNNKPAASLAPPSSSSSALLPLLRGLLTDGAAFGLTSASAFFALGGTFFLLYGRLFLHEAFLHHLGRLDPRHNFSAYFYPIYLQHFGGLGQAVVATGGGEAAAAAGVGVVVDPARWAGLPQVAALLAVAAALHAHLPLAWLISTVAFVALNKVSTAQYFVWYFCLLPPVLPHLLRWRWQAQEGGGGGGGGRAAAANGTPPSSRLVPRPSVPRPLMIAAAAWAVLQLHWLAWGYAVEFAGRGAFLGLWAASVAFLAANAALAAALVREYGRGGVPAADSFVALSLKHGASG